LGAAVSGAARAAWSVGLLLSAVYLATFAGLPEVPDAEVEFQTTSALVRTGRADLQGTPEADALIAAGFGVAPGEGERAGRWYARYGIGQALAALPLHKAGQGLSALAPQFEARHARDSAWGARRSEYFAHLAVGARNPLLGAATAALLVLIALRLGLARATAWCCGLGYGLTTFAWPQARYGLSDVQATFFLVLAFHGMLGPRAARARAALGVGLALAAAVATRVAVLPAALVLLVAVLARLRRAPAARAGGLLLPACAALPFALGLAALAAWNRARFGSALETGYGHGLDYAGFLSGDPLHGAWSLLVAPGRGLLWMAPALALLPLARERAREGEARFWWRASLAVALAVLVPAACLRGWHGAWTYGPRYLLPLLPFAWLGVGLALESRRGRQAPARAAALALCGLGLVVQLAGTAVDAGTHLDLGLQAAREVWPTPAGVDEREMEERRFDRMQWDWRFAAPWAHLRILRERLAGAEERFDARALYFVATSRALEPAHARERGFAHLAWVDFHKRLGGSPGPAAALCGALLALGLAAGRAAFRGPEQVA
jgi:hypothetical protein